MQTSRWSRLISPGIVAIVGAGGKTTVLSKLVEYGGLKRQPMVVTTTTRLYRNQVEQWKPYLSGDFTGGEEHCLRAIRQGRCGAWFAGTEGTKVLSLPPHYIDELYQLHPDWQIVVEADGAKEKWLKAPKLSEPVLPRLTRTTIGVLNLQVLGMALTEEHIHNMDLVMDIMQRPEGAVITPGMLARLVSDPKGLFQYSLGRRILFCTGYDTVDHRIIDGFLDMLAGADIQTIFLADGYKASCEIRRVIQWQ